MQQQLHLSSKQLGDTWAYMNDVENQTSLTMKDFATSIPIALGPLRQMGGTVQDLGTLLTGLVSRGIQVGKAANAIKAAAQRLLRPSQEVQDQFAAITGSSITEIAKKNQGNLLGMLQDIYKVTKDLSQYNRAKVFAGLFGSFQLSTMSAMVDSMGDLANKTGQVYTAQQIGTKSAEEWGRVQKLELDQITNSMSGRFKRAVETVKAELADMGGPFLEAASFMLKTIGALLHGFNALPDPIKRVAMVGALMVAAFGPIKMLTGLVGNFSGSIIKSIGSIGMWKTGWRSLTLEQKADLDVAALMEKQMLSEGEAAAVLTKNIQSLTYALQQQAIATATASRGLVVLPTNVQTAMTDEQRQAYYMSQAPTHRANGQFTSQAEKEAYAAAQMKNFNDEAEKAAKNTAKTEESTRRIGPSMKTAAVGSGLLAAGMTASMVSSDKIVQNVANWAMIMGSIGMVAPMIGSAFKSVTTRIALAREATAGLAVEGAAASTSLGAGTIAMEAMGGPIGIALAGVTAIGIGAYAWSKHEAKITQERKEQNAALYNQNELLSKALGIDQQRARTLTYIPATTLGDKGPKPAYTQNIGQQIANSIKAYQNDPSGKELVANYKNAQSEAEKAAIAEKIYNDTLVGTHGNALKAKIALTALFRAAGDSAEDADSKTLQYAKGLSNLSDYARNQKVFGDLFKSAAQTNAGDTKEQGEALGKMLATAVVNGIRHGNKDIFASIKAQVNEGWMNAIKGLDGTVYANTLSKMHIDTPDKASTFVNDFLNNKDISAGALEKKYGISAADMNSAILAAGQLEGQMGKMRDTQQAIIDGFREQLHIPDAIHSLDELQNTFQFKLATVTPKGARDLYQNQLGQIKEQRAALMGVEAIHTDISGEQKKQLRTQIDQNLEARGYKGIWDQADKTIKKAKDDVAAIPNNKYVTIQINTKQQLASIWQNAMSGVQSDMSTAASNLLDKQAQAAQDAQQAAQQRAQDALSQRQQGAQEALQRRQQAAQDAFDKRWQKRTDAVNRYYDNAEKKIDHEISVEQKAEAERQKIFEAEKARLDYLTDAQNRNIDFNVAIQEGSLDEAAKIMNDANNAAMQFAINQGQAQDADSSAKRQDRLQKQKDRLEKERNQALKHLQKEEDDAKKHFDRIQQMQSDALQHAQQMQSQALQTEQQNQQKALQAEWDARKTNLQAQLDLFTSYVAKNKGDLAKWMKEVGLSYSDFGINTLQPMSETWGKYFQDSFHQHLRAAGAQTASDNMWQALGKMSMQKMLQGMGFPSMSGFKHFIQTGELPSDFGKPPKKGANTLPPGLALPHSHAGRPGDNPDLGGYHGGGILGYDKPSGRGGYSGGLKPDEGWFLGQHGEMVMTKAATKKHGAELRQMNAESAGVGGEQSPGMIGFSTAVASSMFLAGFKKSLQNIVDTTRKHSGKHGITGGESKGFVSGQGGRHRPVPSGIGLVRGIHDVSTGYPAIDIAAGLNTPAYAVYDGKITQSRAVTQGGSPGNGLYSVPYRSYGNVIYLQTKGGPEVLYAHLNKRLVHAGQNVKGGSLIGYTGNTGNSTGPHLHFGDNDGNPMEWMRTGGHILRDGVYRGHADETVLTKPLSRDLKMAVKAFGEIATDRKLRTNLANLGARDRSAAAARGVNSLLATGDTYTYDVDVNVLEPGASAQEIVREVKRELKHEEGRKPGKRNNR
jgi:TP901 family phage tail tape measure protein